jgi:hypothetical protein
MRLGAEPTGVEPCLGGTFRTSSEQDGASNRSSSGHLEVVTKGARFLP